MHISVGKVYSTNSTIPIYIYMLDTHKIYGNGISEFTGIEAKIKISYIVPHIIQQIAESEIES